MRYLSLFSGIEACTVAWHGLGWTPVAFSEIERFPCQLLEHYYRDVPNLGDVSKITRDDLRALGPIDLVVGGSPCQDLSVAGKGAGLSGERSGLFFEQMRIFHAARHICGARWLLWENVPGAFSTNEGRDFGVVVGELAGTGALDRPQYGWGKTGVALGVNGLVEWSVLDAQHFGVPQRRRRVFALLDTGDWASRPPILFNAESLRGDSKKGGKEGKKVAPAVTGGPPYSRTGNERVEADALVVMSSGQANAEIAIDRSPTINLKHDGAPIVYSFDQTMSYDTPTYEKCGTLKTPPNGKAGAIQGSMIGRDDTHGPQGSGLKTENMFTLNTKDRHAVCITGDATHALVRRHDSSEDGCGRGTPIVSVSLRGREGGATAEVTEDYFPALRASQGGGDKPYVLSEYQIRRLTPRECERLQGFPDDYTAIPDASDTARYKALGNSMAVPVMRWIAERIEGLVR